MHKLKRYYPHILLGLIFLLALVLRVYKLNEFPVGFHIDEASLGYNGYSFLLTGKDEGGHVLPLYIDMFGDNRPSGYHYLTIIPIEIFGLTEFSTRLPAALFGTFSILAIFLLSYVIFKDKRISLVSSLLLALAPWNIILSRASGEAIVALSFIITGFSLVLYSMQVKKVKFIIIGVLCIIVSFFFYHTPRVFVPSLFILLLIFLWKVWFSKKSIKFTLGIITGFIFTGFVACILVFFVSGGTGRFSQVNIFGFPETRLVMNEQIREDGTEKAPLIMTRIFHNKLVNYSETFITNYFEYFSGNFLFMKGGLPIWYIIPNSGLLYLIELPFILIGGIYLILKRKPLYFVPIIWLLAAPITAAITVDDIPNINRALVMFPMLEVLAAVGFIAVISYYKKYLRILILSSVISIFCFSITYFLHQYFVQAHAHRTWYRNNGFAEMIGNVKKVYYSYDNIIITKATGGVYPLLLFYMQYDPKIYQAEGSPKGKDYDKIDKFIFVPQACPSFDQDDRFPKTGKTLYINKGDCPDGKFTDIYREDGTKAFRLQL